MRFHPIVRTVLATVGLVLMAGVAQAAPVTYVLATPGVV